MSPCSACLLLLPLEPDASPAVAGSSIEEEEEEVDLWRWVHSHQGGMP